MTMRERLRSLVIHLAHLGPLRFMMTQLSFSIAYLFCRCLSRWLKIQNWTLRRKGVYGDFWPGLSDFDLSALHSDKNLSFFEWASINQRIIRARRYLYPVGELYLLPPDLYKLHLKYYYQAYFEDLDTLWKEMNFTEAAPRAWSGGPLFSATIFLRNVMFPQCFETLGRGKELDWETSLLLVKTLRKIRVLLAGYPDQKFPTLAYKDLNQRGYRWRLSYGEVATELKALADIFPKRIPDTGEKTLSIARRESKEFSKFRNLPKPHGCVEIFVGSWTKLESTEEVLLILPEIETLFLAESQQMKQDFEQRLFQMLGRKIKVLLMPKIYFDWMKDHGDCMLRLSFQSIDEEVGKEILLPESAHHAWLMRSLVYSISRIGKPMDSLYTYALPLLRINGGPAIDDQLADTEKVEIFNETFRKCISTLNAENVS